MATVERMSISIGKRNASEIRKLVEIGSFESISAAFEEAATILIEQQAEAAAWWAETVQRCERAAECPERLFDADSFFREVRKEIDARCLRLGIK